MVAFVKFLQLVGHRVVVATHLDAKLSNWLCLALGSSKHDEQLPHSAYFIFLSYIRVSFHFYSSTANSVVVQITGDCLFCSLSYRNHLTSSSCIVWGQHIVILLQVKKSKLYCERLYQFYTFFCRGLALYRALYIQYVAFLDIVIQCI